MNSSNIVISDIVINDKIKFTITEFLLYESFDDKLKFSKDEGVPYKITFSIDLCVPSLVTVKIIN